MYKNYTVNYSYNKGINYTVALFSSSYAFLTYSIARGVFNK